MIINNFDINKQVLIVAEICNNHEGSYKLAKRLIIDAAETGVNAVKFQTFNTDYYINNSEVERKKRLKSFELTYKQFKNLHEIALDNKLIFLSTPFDLDSVVFLNKIVPAFKIASSDNTFYPLIQQIAYTGKPIILSSGLADINTIKKTKKLIDTIWKNNNIQSELAILHCVTNYPVKPNDANLFAIKSLINELDCTIGYSDHTLGIDASILSVALGARIIEKHFTVNKNYSDFRDHKLSSDKKEMTKLVKKVRETEKMLGKYQSKQILDSEKIIINSMRRSIVSKTYLRYLLA